MLMDMTIREFIAELASDSPAPGGGSVAALSGSLAAALVSMVVRLTVDMKGVPERDRRMMQDALEECNALLERLQEYVDKDTDAFNRVMQAYRMPKDTDEQKKQRSQAIQKALEGAAMNPLEVAWDCLKVLGCCRTAVAYGNPNALSDAGVACLLSYSGVVGALLNVAINLEGIKDEDFKHRIDLSKNRLLEEVDSLCKETMALANSKLDYKVYNTTG